jgi:small subunit ribosomal protein S2
MALPEFSMRQLLGSWRSLRPPDRQRWNPKMGEYIYGDRNGITSST